MTIIDLLNNNAVKYPKEIALVEIQSKYEEKSKITWKDYATTPPVVGQKFRREISWEKFNNTANQFANLLISRGCKKEDKIALLLMNSIEWLPIYFAILKVGAIVVPLNYRYTAEEIKYCIDKADCSMMIFGPEFNERIDSILNSIPSIKNLFYVGEDCPTFAEDFNNIIKDCSTNDPIISIDEKDDAAIYFSSGTTGFPKAILHTHKGLMHAANVEYNHHNQTHEDVFLCIPPLYHTGAKMHWFGSLLTGGKTVLIKGIKPEWILKVVSEEKCSIVWLLVPLAQDILNEIENGNIDLNNYCLNQWRLMHIGAQPVPPSLIKRWLKCFPNHQYDTNYGLSEAIGPGCIHLGIENTHKVGAIGKAGYGWQIKIVDENDNIVKPGEVGELCVYGPGVMKCYYKDEKATSETIHNGWLLTGDMAMEDEDGFVYLVDRKKDVIITGGENIYPVQIEDYLRKNDKIKDVAVIGLPDNRLGEISAAIIELKQDVEMTEEEVMLFCNGLPRYKRPRKVIFADVPRNPTGKIEKPVLRKKYSADQIIYKQIEKQG